MTLLPILERELRMRARSRTHYWGRCGVGLLGAVIALPPLLGSSAWQTPAMIAQSLFTGVVTAGFLLSCAACLVTADSISAERREGTLGLLLLTRVRGFDVLLGKFASSGTTCLFALAAFLPVLMIPILAGGVSGGEVVRKGAVLLNTSFLALSAGLWASARAYERFRANRAALFLVAGLVLLPCLLGWLLPPWASLKAASPLGGMIYAAESAYRLSCWHFWASLCFVHLAGWALVGTSAVRLRRRLRSEEEATTGGLAALPLHQAEPASQRSGREADVEPRDAGSAEEMAFSPSSLVRHSSFRSSSESSPLDWLLRRQRGMQGIVWGAALVSCLQYLFLYAFRFTGVGSPGVYMGVSYALSAVVSAMSGALLAWAASRFLVEARRSGELELLLTTPLGAQALVSTQWKVLKRLLRGPVVLMLTPELLQGFALLLMRTSFPTQSWKFYFVTSILLSAVNIVVGVGALCRLGMWFGLRGEGQARAILWTVGLGRIVPYALGLACALLFQALFSVLSGLPSGSGWFFSSLLPHLLTLAYSVWLFRLASRKAEQELSEVRPLSWRGLVADAFGRGAAAIRWARRWTPG